MAWGDGRIYQPHKDGKPLGTWYYELFFNGRRKVGRGFRTRGDAAQALKAERKRKARGEFIAPEIERLTSSAVLDDYVSDLRDRGKKSIPSVKCRVELLKNALGDVRALDLRTGDVEDYRRERLLAGINKATIDREVEILRASFRLAMKRERLPKVPYFPFFNVDNVRMGFLEPEETAKLIAGLPGVLAEIVTFASLTGWRISEILSLRWESVDMRVREVRLGTTKNGRPRTLAVQGPLWELILRRWQDREYKTRSGSGIATHVFHRRGGRPVSYSGYRKAFVGVCRAAAIEGRTTHDFRRTVARDLRRAGVSETVCMTITGHESPQIFRRYAIVATKEQEAAFEARAALLASEQARAQGSNLATLKSRADSTVP